MRKLWNRRLHAVVQGSAWYGTVRYGTVLPRLRPYLKVLACLPLLPLAWSARLCVRRASGNKVCQYYEEGGVQPSRRDHQCRRASGATWPAWQRLAGCQDQSLASILEVAIARCRPRTPPKPRAAGELGIADPVIRCPHRGRASTNQNSHQQDGTDGQPLF